MSTAVGDAQTHMDEQARYAEKLDKAKREILTDPNELIEFLQDLDGPDHFTIVLASLFKANIENGLGFEVGYKAGEVCDVAFNHPIVKRLAEQIADREE